MLDTVMMRHACKQKIQFYSELYTIISSKLKVMINNFFKIICIVLFQINIVNGNEGALAEKLIKLYDLSDVVLLRSNKEFVLYKESTKKVSKGLMNQIIIYL